MKTIITLLLTMVLLIGVLPCVAFTEEAFLQPTDEEVPAEQVQPSSEEPEEGSETVYRAFELSLCRDGDELSPEGRFRVSIETGIVEETLIPDGAEKTGKEIRLYHIHGDTADVIEDAEMDENGHLTFTTPNFSTFLLSYTVTYRQIVREYLTTDGETYQITVTYDEAAGIPDDADLSVREILRETEEYMEYAQRVNSALESEERRINRARFFDITIVSDGEPIQPLIPVNIRIELKEEFGSSVAAVHFGEKNRMEFLTAELTDARAETMESAVLFDAEGFSVYGIVTLSDIIAGKTYAILNTNDGTSPSGTALTSAASGDTRLQGKSTTVKVNTVSRKENVYIAKDSEITTWSFQKANPDNPDDAQYYITTEIGGILKYLKIDTNKVSVGELDDDCKITIEEGTGSRKGKIRLYNSKGVIRLNGSNFERAGTNTGGDAVWMNLAEKSELLTESDFVVYTATKTSVSGSVTDFPTSGSTLLDDGTYIDYDVNDGDLLILYTRIWNEETSRYDYYVVDYDGVLVKAYENGDTISWVGTNVNTMEWQLTEKYKTAVIDGQEEQVPRYSYNLQNYIHRDKYIAPMFSTHSIISDNPASLYLNGRKYKEYYTTILNWDASEYHYAGLDDGEDPVDGTAALVSVLMENAESFYFAKMTVTEPEETLNLVETIDHRAFGIVLKIQDYENINSSNRSKDQVDVLGNTPYNQWTGSPGLLEKNLTGEYPRVKNSSHSLSELYNNTIEVKQQFLLNTYNETGYFEYDSTRNFAHLISSADDPWVGKTRPDGGTYGVGDFVIYDQLGTSTEGQPNGKETLMHGQFLPFNDLISGFDEQGKPIAIGKSTYKNTRDIHAVELSSLDPRNGEALYGIPYKKGKTAKDGYVDHFFGMEMTASFMQSESGLDDWGHDLIFEFSGDDDFWFYVDGRLILDLGGIHSALDGSINFRTGKVIVNGRETNLRTLFIDAYKEENPGVSDTEAGTWADSIFKENEDGIRTVFTDFSGHTMRMFYQERGAGASNLHMRFNLAPYKQGEVLLEKKVSGSENVDTEFPFQIYYRNTDTSHEYVLAGNEIPVLINGESVTGVDYEVDGLKYENVYKLKRGQTQSRVSRMVLTTSKNWMYLQVIMA